MDFEFFTEIEYLPSKSVVVLVSSKVTVTPGIVFPCASVTVPEILNLSVCALIMEEKINRNNKNSFFII